MSRHQSCLRIDCAIILLFACLLLSWFRSGINNSNVVTVIVSQNNGSLPSPPVSNDSTPLPIEGFIQNHTPDPILVTIHYYTWSRFSPSLFLPDRQHSQFKTATIRIDAMSRARIPKDAAAITTISVFKSNDDPLRFLFDVIDQQQVNHNKKNPPILLRGDTFRDPTPVRKKDSKDEDIMIHDRNAVSYVATIDLWATRAIVIATVPPNKLPPGEPRDDLIIDSEIADYDFVIICAHPNGSQSRLQQQQNNDDTLVPSRLIVCPNDGVIEYVEIFSEEAFYIQVESPDTWTEVPLDESDPEELFRWIPREETVRTGVYERIAVRRMPFSDTF